MVHQVLCYLACLALMNVDVVVSSPLPQAKIQTLSNAAEIVAKMQAQVTAYDNQLAASREVSRLDDLSSSRPLRLSAASALLCPCHAPSHQPSRPHFKSWLHGADGVTAPRGGRLGDGGARRSGARGEEVPAGGAHSATRRRAPVSRGTVLCASERGVAVACMSIERVS